MQASPEALDVVVVEESEEGPVLCAGWLRYSTGTDFASMWGGSTLPGWRRQGLYRATVAHRARLARERGYRFMRLDTSPDSRPILMHLGLSAVATTTPSRLDARDSALSTTAGQLGSRPRRRRRLLRSRGPRRAVPGRPRDSTTRAPKSTSTSCGSPLRADSTAPRPRWPELRGCDVGARRHRTQAVLAPQGGLEARRRRWREHRERRGAGRTRLVPDHRNSPGRAHHRRP